MSLTSKSRKVAGAIPIYEEDKVILVSNSKGNLIFPKGGVKKNETFEKACKREAMEEGGIEGNIREVKQIKKKGIVFFILDVVNLLDSYDEKKKRERVIISISDAKSSNRTPSYVKEILFELKPIKTD